MIVSGLTAKQFQDLAISTLRAACTLAADRVYEQRDWPTGPGMMPAMLVKVTKERCVSLSRNGPYAFNTTFTLVVIARQAGITPEVVSPDLLLMVEQIKNAFLANQEFNQNVQQFVSIETDVVVSAEAKQAFGEVGMQLEVEIFQEYGPDDGVPLTEIHGTITDPSSGATSAEFEAAFTQP